MSALKVLVVFGGRSGEHEVSVASARTVTAALDELGHVCVPVGITRRGRWVHAHPADADAVDESARPYVLTPDAVERAEVDVAFPVLHGPHGEDGTIQGFFELAGIPYVGSGVEGSVVAVNKVLSKRLLGTAGLPGVDFVAFTNRGWAERGQDLRLEVEKLGWPCFAKPARLGSSVGISKVSAPADLDDAVERALMHDDLVLVEGAGGSRELEIGAIQDADGVSLSVIGEIVPQNEFYDYEAKYRGRETELLVPAPIPGPVEARLRDLARRAFEVIGCEGFARIDFFWDEQADVLRVNELNTIPGLTGASMFPRVWEASGVPFREVTSRLLDHALRRHAERKRLEESRLAAHAEEIGAAG